MRSIIPAGDSSSKTRHGKPRAAKPLALTFPARRTRFAAQLNLARLNKTLLALLPTLSYFLVLSAVAPSWDRCAELC